MKDCPALKSNRVCEVLTQQQGWACSVSEDTCDGCGGPSDVTYLTVLGRQLDEAALGKASRPVQVSQALIKRYPEQAEAIKGSDDYRAKVGWRDVREGWAKATSLGKSLTSRVVGEPISLKVLQSRHISCHGTLLDGTVVAPACSKRQVSQDGEHHYCGACGCGDTKIARLDGDGYTKLQYPHLECPLKRAGFGNAALPLLRFGCGGGIGDLCVHSWHAEGYKAQGGVASFKGASRHQATLLRVLGQQLDDSPGEAVVTGGKARHYQVEVKVDKGQHPRALVWSAVLGNLPLKRPTHHIGQRAVDEAKGLLGKCDPAAPLVLLFPCAEWSPRVWPKGYWVDLYWTLRHNGCNVKVLGAREGDVETWKGDSIWGYDWETIAALMKVSQLVVGNDSGPAHLAGTLGINTVALMGPTSNVFTHYQTVREVSLSREVLPCTGCHFDASRGFRHACDLQCESLMGLKPGPVAAACMEALKLPLVARDPSWETVDAGS